LTKRVALVAVTIAVSLLLLTTFSLQSIVLYSQIIQQQSSYAQELASPITDGNASSSSPPPGNSSSSSRSPFVEPGPPLPVEPDRGPGGQPGEPGGPIEPQQQPPPQQTVDSDNNLTKTDGILTATINGANFVRNQTISVEGKVDDADITPESGVWITVKDPMNETTHAIFVPLNAADKSFSYGIVAGYYDGNSYGFYKPMSVSGKNYMMTVVYNTDDGPSTSTTTTSSGNNKSSLEVQFVFAYDHSSTTPPPVSAAVTADTDTGPASAASQFAGNQSTTGNQSMTTTNMTTTAPTKTNGLLTASINGTHFTTNQTIAVNGTVREAAGPFITVYVELKDPHNDTLAFEFVPIVRSNKSGLNNETSFSYSLVAGRDDSDAANSDSGGGHNRRFWKPMNETGSNYTMIVGYATPAPPSSPGSAVAAVGGGEYSRSEVQFVFAYEHLLPSEEEEAAAVATTTTTPAEEPEPEPVVEPEVSEEDGEDCDNSYPDECIPPPPPVLECSDIDEDDFEVRGSDPHGFDDDNDGMGCQTAPQA
jgi:hypothetical protein